MRLPIIPALATAVIAAGLTLGALIPTNGVGTPTPPPIVMEDDPDWQCTQQGDYICGAVTDDVQKHGWEVFDTAHAAAGLRLDPSRPYRIDFRGWAVRSPKLQENDVAVVGTDFKWYVFRATYLDGKPV